MPNFSIPPCFAVFQHYFLTVFPMSYNFACPIMYLATLLQHVLRARLPRSERHRVALRLAQDLSCTSQERMLLFREFLGANNNLYVSSTSLHGSISTSKTEPTRLSSSSSCSSSSANFGIVMRPLPFIFA